MPLLDGLSLSVICLLCELGRALLVLFRQRAITMETVEMYLQTIPTQLLAAAARGEVNLNELARAVLAGRGVDANGQWVGFEASARLMADLLG